MLEEGGDAVAPPPRKKGVTALLPDKPALATMGHPRRSDQVIKSCSALHSASRAASVVTSRTARTDANADKETPGDEEDKEDTGDEESDEEEEEDTSDDAEEEEEDNEGDEDDTKKAKAEDAEMKLRSASPELQVGLGRG
jgi:chromatin remodeling complex protein RSC6